jgi:hypothetical protein
MEIFGHGDGDAQRKRVRALAVAVKDEVAGDGSLRYVDGGASGPAEYDGCEDIADAGVRNAMSAGIEMSSKDLDLSAGHGCRRHDSVQVRSVGRDGVEEAHPNSRVERPPGQYKLRGG